MKVGIAGEVLVELEDGDVARRAFSSEGENASLNEVVDRVIEQLGSIQRDIERRQAQADTLAEEED